MAINPEHIETIKQYIRAGHSNTDICAKFGNIYSAAQIETVRAVVELTSDDPTGAIADETNSLKAMLTAVLDFSRQDDLTSPLSDDELAVVRHPAILVDPISVTKRIGFAILNYNYRHVQLLHGAERIRVLMMESAKNGAFHSRSDFVTKLSHITLVERRAGGAATVPSSLAKAWLEHHASSEVNRWAEEVFKPLGINQTNRKLVGDRKFNMWQGFGWEPLPLWPDLKAGSEVAAWMATYCPTLHDYLFEVLASKRGDVYQFLLAWLADMIQNPARTDNRVALIFKSRGEGTGKDTFAKIALSLLPPANVVPEGSVDDLVRFTGAFAGALLVVFPEFSFDAGNDSAAVRRNSYQLIDSPTMRCEDKGLKAQTVDNTARVIKTTNDENPLPRGSIGRRFSVIEPSSHRVDDAPYWKTLHGVINDHTEGGEWHRFATILARLKIKGFEPAAHKPSGAEMLEVIDQSITGIAATFREVLDRGRLPYSEVVNQRAIDRETCGKRRKRDEAPWLKLLKEMSAAGSGRPQTWGRAYHVQTDPMRTYLEGHIMRERLIMSDTKLGAYLAYFAVDDRDHSTNGLARGKWWPELWVCRRLFELIWAKGNKIDWANDLTEWIKTP